MTKKNHKNSATERLSDIINGQPLVSDQVTVACINDKLLLDFHLEQTSSANKTSDDEPIQRVVIPRAIVESFIDMIQSAVSGYREQSTNELEKFFGLWSDMTAEEALIFEQIEQDRSLHFDRENPFFIDQVG